MVILRRKRWAFGTGDEVMPVDLRSFGGLYEKLFAIDLTGVTDGVHPPLKTVNNVRAATAKGRRSCRWSIGRIFINLWTPRCRRR
jgi:hypothetical protein